MTNWFPPGAGPLPPRAGLTSVSLADGPAGPPTVMPVVVWTLFFGLFGVISAALRGDKARRLGADQSPYWIAWGVTCFVGIALWWLVGQLLVATA